MNENFKINKTMYIILFVVFAFGVMMEVTRSSYILQFNPFVIEEKTYRPIQLPKELTSTLPQQSYLVVTNPDSQDSLALTENINQTLRYMHKQVDERTISALPTDFSAYNGIIITFGEVDQLPDLTTLESYVEEGGSVFFAIRPGMNDTLYRIYRKLGIYDPGTFTIAHGMEMTSNLLINNKGLVIDNDLYENSSLSAGLEPIAEIHMRSVNNIPLLWDVSYGEGKFVVFNGTMLHSKDNRGVVTGAISLMEDHFIYPIMNMKLAFIDAFPAPIPEGKNEAIYEEYELDIQDFYRNVWWPTIQKGSAKYDVKYAGFLLQTHTEHVQGPFEVMNKDHFQSLAYGRELLKQGGELGLQGYNHQPLTTSQENVSDLGIYAWIRKQDMVEALQQVSAFAEDVFPTNTMKTYAPPANRIDEEGLAAIKEAIPTIEVISSVYLPDSNELSFTQEFTKDERFIHLPRITGGYEYTDHTKWSIANAISSIGVFSHAIYPDELLAQGRLSAKNWEQLSDEYNRMHRDVKENHPWLNSLTPAEAGKWLEQLLTTSIYIEDTDDKLKIYIDGFTGEHYFLLRTKKKIMTTKDCTVEKIDDGVYLVIGKKEIFEIGLGDE